LLLPEIRDWPLDPENREQRDYFDDVLEPCGNDPDRLRPA
jgi:hypothetical protein